VLWVSALSTFILLNNRIFSKDEENFYYSQHNFNDNYMVNNLCKFVEFYFTLERIKTFFEMRKLFFDGLFIRKVF